MPSGIEEQSRNVSQPSSSEDVTSRRKGKTASLSEVSTTRPTVHIVDLLAAGILSMSQTGQDRCVLCEHLRLYGNSVENVVCTTIAIPLYVCAHCAGFFDSEVQPKETNTAFTTGWLVHHRK